MEASGMATSSEKFRIRSSCAVAETRGRSSAAQVSTAANAQPSTPGTATDGVSLTTKRTPTLTVITRPITPVTRPLLARKVWTSSDIGRSPHTLVSRSGRGVGAARLGFLVPGPQPYAGEMTSTATAAAGHDNDWADITASEASLRRFLHGLPGVDQVGAEARAAGLGTRSIKTTAKAYAIDLAIRMVDLTTLEGADTPGKVRALASKAMRPDPADQTCPSVAAVCVYPDMVPFAKETLSASGGSSGVHIASVATAFPSGRAARDIKLADVKDAVDAGADEIDMVIDRGAFLSGRYLEVFEEIAAVRESCGGAHLKVIFET